VKVLVDVNLSPAWTKVLADHHIEAVHWTLVGDPRSADAEVMRYARDHGYVVFTHDLDFGTLLALTRALGPSVVQVRAQNVLPEAIGGLVARSGGPCRRARVGRTCHRGPTCGEGARPADSLTEGRGSFSCSRGRAASSA
jgi:predicted nuclease of predicted toxin-antitoxin system